MGNITFHIKMVNELPEHFIIENIKDAIKNNEIIKNEKSREHLLAVCGSLLLKDFVKKEGVDKAIKHMEQVGSISNFFKTSDN